MWKSERVIGITMSQFILERLERLTYDFKINSNVTVLKMKKNKYSEKLPNLRRINQEVRKCVCRVPYRKAQRRLKMTLKLNSNNSMMITKYIWAKVTNPHPKDFILDLR